MNRKALKEPFGDGENVRLGSQEKDVPDKMLDFLSKLEIPLIMRVSIGLINTPF